MVLFNLLLVMMGLGCFVVSGCQTTGGGHWELVYETDFTEIDKVSDWVMEGPGSIQICQGKMTVWPLAQEAMVAKWESIGRRVLDPRSEYYPTVEAALKKANYPLLGDLYNSDGVMSGGHIVLWNRGFETEGDYAVEFDFKPLSPIGLAILFFSAEGVDGEELFSDQLKERHGVFASYTKSDINCYHISYWANNCAVGKRGTCNFRKNSGFFNVADGVDPSANDLDYASESFTFKTYRIRLEKINDRITFSIDGKTVIDFQDKQFNDVLNHDGELQEKQVDTGPALEGGRIGLRQMVGLKAEYSNFRVYRLVKP